MEFLFEAIPQVELEWGRVVLWTGMLTIILVCTALTNLISQAVTSLIFSIAKFSNKSDGDRLRLGGDKFGFDIVKSTLNKGILVILMIPLILAIFSKTNHCFPLRITL